MPADRAAAVARLRAALQGGADIPDSAFDGLLPEHLRHEISEAHWTPARTCRLAAGWLAPDASARVLDVGAGVGKLSLIGALSTGARFTGVEIRPHLVETARALAAELSAGQASFVCADAVALDWSGYDALYFFNPFSEVLFPDDRRIDASLPFGEAEQGLAMARVFAKLAALREGTRVVVYHALGCRFPDGFHRARREFSVHSTLELWVRGDGDLPRGLLDDG